MARRGFAILFTLLGVAFFISIVGFAAAVSRCSAASRPCRRTRRSSLRVGGDLDRSGAGRRRRLSARRPHADRARDRRQPAQGQGRFARPRGAAEADRLRVAVLGQGAGSPRRGARLQEVGQAGLRVSRIRRRSRVLPGDRGRQGLPDAVERRSTSTASPPTSCSCAARSTRSARIPDLHHIGDYKTASTRSPKRASPPRTRRWTSR